MPFDEFCREEREALVEILRAAEAALSSGIDISEGRTGDLLAGRGVALIGFPLTS